MNLNRYNNFRLWAVLLTSFSSGLPLLLSSTTLQAWFSSLNVSLLVIGSLSLCGLPYTLKFLWAPFLDRFAPLSFLDRRRGWLVLMQLGVAALLLLMSYSHPSRNVDIVMALAFLVALISATQDTAIDAYRTDITHPEERGIAASLLMVGYRAAMLVAGAVALMMAAEIGWHWTYVVMATCMLGLAVTTLIIPAPPKVKVVALTFQDAMLTPFKEFLSRNNAVIILMFIILYKLGDGLVLNVTTPFLIRTMGFSLVTVGSISKTVGLSAVLLGGVVGGLLFPLLGLYRALLYFGIGQILSNLCFAWLALAGKQIVIMIIAVFCENFAVGLATVAFVAFLMSLCHRQFTATQYAIFSALMSLPRILTGPLAAEAVTHVGWVSFFCWSSMLGIPGLMILVVMRYKAYDIFITNKVCLSQSKNGQ